MSMKLLDSSVLVRYAGPSGSRRDRAKTTLKHHHDTGVDLTICPHVIAEFWAVATRPINVRGGLGLTITQAKNWVDRFTNTLFHFIDDTPKTYEKWIELVCDHSITGVKTHDARVVASAIAGMCDGILTFDAKFEKLYSQELHIELLSNDES